MTLTLLAPAQEAVEASLDAPLSKEQKRLIRDSFTRIEPASDLVARLFYMKSVDLDPTLRTLFKAPSRAQRRKFMGGMKVALISLDRLQSLKPILRLLERPPSPRRHRAGPLRDLPARLGLDPRAIARGQLSPRSDRSLDGAVHQDDPRHGTVGRAPIKRVADIACFNTKGRPLMVRTPSHSQHYKPLVAAGTGRLHLLDLLHDLFQIVAGRILHRRVVDIGLKFLQP